VVAVVAVVVSEVAVVVSVVAVIEEVVVVSAVEEVAVDFEVAEDVETDIKKKKRNCFVFFLPVICHFLYDNNN
jgi:hypothetical protein